MKREKNNVVRVLGNRMEPDETQICTRYTGVRIAIYTDRTDIIRFTTTHGDGGQLSRPYIADPGQLNTALLLGRLCWLFFAVLFLVIAVAAA